MTDHQYRVTYTLLGLASLFLLLAIPLTIYLQQSSAQASLTEEVGNAVSEPIPVAVADSPASESVPNSDSDSGSVTSSEGAQVVPDIPDSWHRYIQVIDGCGPHFAGDCLRVRSGPGEEYPVIASLRNGVLLKVEAVVKGETYDWYQVVFDEWLRYPERVEGEWYVAAPFVRELHDPGPVALTEDTPTTSKHIIVDRSDQTLAAYEGDELFLELDISTGIEMSPTPRGEFTVFKKTPTRYMQGPLPYLTVSKYYDLPGVPWNLYFTEQGAVIHGTYWHDSFGSQYSSGCVNVAPESAKRLYQWADLGTSVLVRD